MTLTDGLPPERLPRPTLFMSIAELHGQRSSCPRAQVGVTATRDNRVIASGYVGAPADTPHCLEVGCLIENDHCIRSIHAEANLIAWCAREGISLKGATLWCTYSPCYNCAKLIVNLGVAQIVYLNYYTGDGGRGVDLLMNLDIATVPFNVVNQP